MQCYICLGDEKEEKLIRPCPCKIVHRKCLAEWRVQNHNAHLNCEVCGRKYNIGRLLIGDIISSKITIFVVSGLIVASSVYVSGNVSAWISNCFYYWFHHLPYHSVNRLQTLVHGLFWTGLPGFIFGIIEMLRNGLLNNLQINDNYNNYRPPIQINLPSQSHIEPPMNNSELKQEEEERKKNNKESKVAKYESPGIGTWMILIIGISLSYWKVWDKLQKWALKKAQEYQDIIEYVV